MGWNGTKGFSFMEILSVISLVAILASIGLPSVSSFHASQQTSATAKIFLADVRLGRYEAIRTGVPHRLVLSALATENSYRVEALDLPPEDGITPAQFADDTNWQSVLDGKERTLDATVSVAVSRATTVYFTPEGRVTEDWVPGMEPTPLVPRRVDFSYGNAVMSVTLNGFGGLSSTEFYEE
ncbi:MAG: prepilin-type N-terminal cleavage/methylation domain-containing protein [Candidatus Riflebacteria bacterium]|nr:prepilin-type N-terminal cleavage/methylation domain-containing protein [Candidatus Riflebacteria bacterium]